MSGEEVDQERLATAIATPVHQGERYVPFGELTLAEVEGRVKELGSIGSAGPLARVAKVARAWSDLGSKMRDSNCASVGDLPPDTILRFAEYLWVIPPKEGMI